jgi:predicted nucleic acid-binding protein
LLASYSFERIGKLLEERELRLQRIKQAADKSWSLTDCASCQVMEAEGIQAVLTHDQHFAQAGFESLPR